MARAPIAAFGVAALTFFPVFGSADDPFLRGDADQNGVLEITDAVNIFGFLFLGSQRPRCMDAADVNDSGDLDLSDGIYVLSFLYSGGPAPAEPYPAAGQDATQDVLGCERYAGCTARLNSVGMRLVFIPPGSFTMGSPDSEPDRWMNEGPVHLVHISRGFYMGVTEVTQGQYLEVIGVNPSQINGGSFGVDLGRPVESVNWADAMEFCRILSQREGKNYRLPREAEWEYACRAGTTTRFWFGDVLSCDPLCEPCAAADPYLWWCGNETPSATHPAGQKEPNPWCLLDMHGGVWEWCMDWYEKYTADERTDPEGARVGEEHIIRGGYWGLGLKHCRSAQRGDITPEHREDFLGFRVLMEAE